MKKYIFLLISGCLGICALIYLHSHSESKLTHNHENTLKLFLTAKQIETTLEKDLLQSRNFLLLSYDSIVTEEASVDQICDKLRGPELHIYKTLSEDLDVSVDNYCQAIDSKMKRVEYFKSKNAIFRNSIYYLQKLATESVLSNDEKTSSEEALRRKLIRASLAYSIVSTSESKEVLSSVLNEISNYSKKTKPKGDLDIVSSHASKILLTKEELDSLTKDIVNSDSSQLLENLRQTYFKNFELAEASALNYRDLVFVICAVFFIFILYSVIRLSKAAQSLTKANETLEHRVEERTRELRDSQETIIRQQQTLISTAKMSALGEMAGGVAHEINTPLAIIGLRVEQLEECVTEGDIDPLEFMEGLEIIRSTTDRIAKIVSGLRFFAREGKRTLPQKTKVSWLIEETVSFCRERFSNHGIDLRIIKDPSYETMEIECRSVEISQVLLNLLNNAFDALETKKNKWIQVRVIDHEKLVEFNITDSGDGIPKEIREKIMQPFFTTKEIGKGTGLGLAVCYGILTEHGGRLDVQSTPGIGTTFTITLPAIINDGGG